MRRGANEDSAECGIDCATMYAADTIDAIIMELDPNSTPGLDDGARHVLDLPWQVQASARRSTVMNKVGGGWWVVGGGCE